MYELAVGFPPIRLNKPSAASAAASAAGGAPNPNVLAAAIANDNRDARQLIQSFQMSSLRFPPWCSADFKDCVTKLLTPDRTKRLGAKPDDAKEVMKHAFFSSGANLPAGSIAAAAVADIDWDKASAGQLNAPGFVIEKMISTVNPKPSAFGNEQTTARFLSVDLCAR